MAINKILNGVTIGNTTKFNQNSMTPEMVYYIDETTGTGRLPAGGITNQVATKNSSADYDIIWKTLTADDIDGIVSTTDVLTKTNTTEYIPSSPYHPATKLYVDNKFAQNVGDVQYGGTFDPTTGICVLYNGKIYTINGDTLTTFTINANNATNVKGYYFIASGNGTLTNVGSFYRGDWCVSNGSAGWCKLSQNGGSGSSGTTGVTGVKGNNEVNYRVGDVNLTAENIGAVKANTPINAGTACKITYNEQGLIIAGDILQANDLPDLSNIYLKTNLGISNSNKNLVTDSNGNVILQDLTDLPLELFTTFSIEDIQLKANNNNDTLTLIAGDNISIVPNQTNRSITISSYGTGSAGGAVTGVRGIKEDSYRVGQVTLTAENVGAIPFTQNITADTGIKISYNEYGLITESSLLEVNDIPDLSNLYISVNNHEINKMLITDNEGNITYTYQPMYIQYQLPSADISTTSLYNIRGDLYYYGNNRRPLQVNDTFDTLVISIPDDYYLTHTGEEKSYILKSDICSFYSIVTNNILYISEDDGTVIYKANLNTGEVNISASSLIYDFTLSQPIITYVNEMHPAYNYFLATFEEWQYVLTNKDHFQLDTSLIDKEETDPTVPEHVKNITTSNIDSWNNKQEQIFFDMAPTELSTNPVTSNGIYNALELKANSSDVILKNSTESYTPTGANDPTTKGYVDNLVATSIDAAISKQLTSIY